jgi:hypothetical protein
MPNRATGHLSFVIRWQSGSATCSFATSVNHLIRLFENRMRLVPMTERDSMTAHFDASVRKAGGGIRRVTLARWRAAEPLPEFYRLARLAFRKLPKEHDDQDSFVPYEIDANHPAAGKAGIASRLPIGHHWPGLPEPGR